MTRIPLSALVLGWAGVLPFAALTAATVLGLALPVDPVRGLIGYAVAILSFMAGVQWGLAMRAPDGVQDRWSGYAVSVLPSLVAWVALFLAPRVALLVLAVTFAALLAYDLWTMRRGWAPGWYGPLRWQLTVAVVVLLVTAAVAVGR